MCPVLHTARCTNVATFEKDRPPLGTRFGQREENKKTQLGYEEGGNRGKENLFED